MAGPLLTILAPAAISMVTALVKRKVIGPQDAKEAEQAISSEIQVNPVLKNELNMEHPVQSRVVWGSTTAGLAGTLGALAVIIDAIQRRDFSNLVLLGTSIATVLGAAYSLYGRLRGGLAPLFARFKRK